MAIGDGEIVELDGVVVDVVVEGREVILGKLWQPTIKERYMLDSLKLLKVFKV